MFNYNAKQKKETLAMLIKISLGRNKSVVTWIQYYDAGRDRKLTAFIVSQNDHRHKDL